MINKSLWLKGIKVSKMTSLKETTYTDVLIIGGGITGISCAYHLKESKLRITIIDSGRVGHGVTANTTGKLTYLQDNTLGMIDIIYGNKYVDNYIKSQHDAIGIVKDIIIDNNINCNFESNSSYLYTVNKSEISKIKNIEKILKKNNIPYKKRDFMPIKFPYEYGIKVEDTAVFHPLKYVMALREIVERSGVNIYEKTKATSFEKVPNGYMVIANGVKIFAKKLVIACHYPFFNVPYLMPFKTYLEKSYLTAGIIDKNRKFNAINIDKETHSIRYYSDNQDYLIYCSESRKLGKNMSDIDNYANICWKAKANLMPDIKYCWFNYDLMTLDGLPIIGCLEKDNPDLLIGTGYNTWGMTNGSIAGKVLSDLIQGKPNDYSEIFDPHRKFSVMKLFNGINFSIKNLSTLVLSKFITNDDRTNNRVHIIEEKGVKYGVYIDDDKKIHKVLNVCPHMKCNLNFNFVDKTWDCPCHGSRFDIDGNVVKGPSFCSIKVEKKIK